MRAWGTTSQLGLRSGAEGAPKPAAEAEESLTVASAKPGRRLRWFIGIALIVGAVAGAWWLASWFQSPDQREANAAAPSPAPIVAIVSAGTLETSRSFDGQVASSVQVPVTLTPPAEAPTAVVTGRPLEVGVTLNDGDVLTEVNGRPVFALFSPFALYRDMGTGDSGPDIVVLQTTLAHRGYDVEVDGDFGARTERAVRAMYRDSGYRVPTRAATSADDESESGGGDSGAEEPLESNQTVAPASVAYVPMSEVQGLSSLPLSVIQGVPVGRLVGAEGAPDFVLGSLEKVVSVSTDPSQVADIVEGDTATLVIGSTEIEARVASVVRDSSEAGAPSDGDGSPSAESPAQATASSFVLAPTSPLGELAAGTPVRVLIKQQIVSEESLLVPVIAITDRGGKNQVVLVRKSNGTFVEVRVNVLGALDGQVAVVPSEAGALKVGDEVKVG